MPELVRAEDARQTAKKAVFAKSRRNRHPRRPTRRDFRYYASFATKIYGENQHSPSYESIEGQNDTLRERSACAQDRSHGGIFTLMIVCFFWSRDRCARALAWATSYTEAAEKTPLWITHRFRLGGAYLAEAGWPKACAEFITGFGPGTERDLLLAEIRYRQGFRVHGLDRRLGKD